MIEFDLLAPLIDSGQFVIKIGPFTVRIQSKLTTVQQGVADLYQDYPRFSADSFCDFYVRVFSPFGLRRYFYKQVLFGLDQLVPFSPLPNAQACLFFEWGLNWSISNFAHQFLIIHAAVIEKQGKALVLPGTPGSGKSTLCAALINSGWRLLSDELTLIDCRTGNIVPVPRPVSLKNESIALITSAFPHNQFSPIVDDTSKGTICLMKPPLDAVKRSDETALPGWIVFPKYEHGTPLQLTPISKGKVFMQLADSSFNYSVLGERGFNVLADMMEHCEGYSFVYGGDFNEAVACFEQLLNASISK